MFTSIYCILYFLGHPPKFVSIRRQELVNEIWNLKTHSRHNIVEHLKSFIENIIKTECNAEVKKLINSFYTNFRSKWRMINRTKRTFLIKFHSWLHESISFPKNIPKIPTVEMKLT